MYCRKLNIPRFRRSTFSISGLTQSPVRQFRIHRLLCCVIRPSGLNLFRRDLHTHLTAGR